MTSRDFCYWLQGFLEITYASEAYPTSVGEDLCGILKPVKILVLGEQQVECIKKHLSLVFKHEIDPSFGGPEKQAELNEIHKPSHPLKPDLVVRC